MLYPVELRGHSHVAHFIEDKGSRKEQMNNRNHACEPICYLKLEIDTFEKGKSLKYI